ncbi:signal transduction protein [Rheinheimera sp. SA_1]|uniref:sensor histidine kinase n=1 Tax=Rheinheimera sp. SA_1 TaxID=1827365 RepID=UPI0007FC82D0|nr:histidine kinase [Rheinheimera sp. SA_1]OBP13636.1 signal transduction protein [Rheinheimera sp. SA_1]
MANVQLQKLLRFNLWYWLSLALLDFALMLLWWLLMPDYKFELPYTASKVAMVILEIVVSTWFIRWSFARQLPPVQVCAAAALILCVYTPLNNLSWMLVKEPEHFLPEMLLSELDTTSLPFFIWVLCYLTFWRYQQQQSKLQESTRLSQNIQQLELQALQHQLNPHFTFNALNSVCALLEAERYDDAETMSEQLSTFLRYSLSKSPDSLVRLADELAAIEAYLTLQKTRFGDKLKVIWQIDESLKAQQIPALLLQPLIENAVKYAVATRQQGATITIHGSHQQEQLLLEVTDDGPGSTLVLDESCSSGVGLTNIRNRLKQHFGDRASLAVLALPTGFQVNICLPWQGSHG